MKKSKKTKHYMETTPSTTLVEIQRFLEAMFHSRTQTNCPACGQHVFKYIREIGAPRAVALFLLYSYEMNRKRDDNPYVYVPPFFARYKSLCNIGGEYAKLRYWDLIERKPGRREDGSRSNGMWRITELGCRFVRKETKVPKWIALYNNSFRGFYSGELVGIEECLQQKFSYQELMGVKVN